MATPMAAGLAALIASHRPGYSPQQVELAMELYATDLGSAGRDDHFGYGRIDAMASLEGASAPVISTLDPAAGTVGSKVTVTGSAFGPVRGSSFVSFSGVPAAIYDSWSDTGISCYVPVGISERVDVTVTTSGGTSGSVPFTVTAPATDWYLAEGSTAGGMETFILVQNPGGVPAEVTLSFMTEGGPKPGPTATLQPGTRRTFKANDYVTTYDVSTLVSSDQPVVAERAMYGDNRTWAHDSIGAVP